MKSLFDSESVRIRIVLVGMIACFACLVIRLWQVQVMHSSTYRDEFIRQSIRRIRLPGSRGKLYDRNGECLADNRPNYCVAVYLEELRQPGKAENTVKKVDETVDSLAKVLKLPREVTPDDIMRHLEKRRPMPFFAWVDVDYQALARFCENEQLFPGVGIYVEPVRVYPNGLLASHVLGYVGKMDPLQNPVEPFHYYLSEMEGREGIEKTLNDTLTGYAGGRLVRVDASGYVRQSVALKQQEKQPIAGHDAYLTIDVRIQKLAEEALEGERGAIVVVDPGNGEILAMASRPTFNPNDFSPAISPDLWKSLRSEKSRKPLLNRAISGQYPPGSIFKPVVALAAMESRVASANTTFNCPGYFTLGRATFRCWRSSGHGSISLVKAIEQSCNAYFCQLGLKCGHSAIARQARENGFGRQAGIELPGEEEGLIPDLAWKKKVLKEGWYDGDTCNMSIGQGAVLVTPLQMAMFAATIANGGYLYEPRIVLENYSTGNLIKHMDWSRSSLNVVRQGMRDVVQADHGTGKRARISDVEMAGKTGTAEYGPSGARKQHTWMTLFAPYDRPRYALAMVIEDGISGGTTVAPKIKKLMEGIFEMEKREERASR